MFEWEQWFKIEQEITNPARVEEEGAKNIYISRRITIDIHVTTLISNQRSTSSQHHSIIFLKQQITAIITPSYANPPYITDRYALKKMV